MLVPRALLLGAMLVTAAAALPPAVAPAFAQSPATAIVVPIVSPSAVSAEAAQAADADARTLADALALRSDRARAELRALQARHDATPFAPLREAFQQRIEAVKREEALDLLDIRLRHARAAGHADEARELASAIEARRKLPIARLRELPVEPAAKPVAPIVTTSAKKEAGR